MNRPLMNIIAFQTCWFACVLGAAAGMPFLGPVFAAIWLPVHILATKSRFAVELKLILVAGVLGYLLDSVLVLGAWMSFPAHTQLGAPSTLWMVTLWLGFAATLRHALGWLRGRYVVGALLGALLGPFAYWSGSKFDAVVLTDTVPSLLAVGAEWLVAMPLLLMVTAYLERPRTDCKTDDAAPLMREECP